MSKPNCSKCKSYNTCDYRKHGETFECSFATTASIYIEYFECCQDKANGAEKNTAAQVVGTGESRTER